jgi:diguanylate cyclase (GGDEF)-like protein
MATTLPSSLANRVAEARAGLAPSSSPPFSLAEIDALLGSVAPVSDHAGAANRQLAAAAIEELQRGGSIFSVLLIDVDGMRRVSQLGGRGDAERLLAEVAAAIGRELSSSDRIYRLEGDEFCVLAPAESQASPRALAERLNAAIESIEGPRGLGLGATIGLVHCSGSPSREALLDLADIAMYRARADGASVAAAA